MSDAPELKPCPFCGGKANIEQYGNRRMSTIVSCGDCGATLENGEEWGHGRSWNTRADLAPSWHRIDDPDNQPPMDGTKILAYDGIGTFTAEWHSCGWTGSEVDGDPLPSDDLPITHWMHLPPPPKEGE